MNTSANGIYAPLGSPLIINKKDFDNEELKVIKGLFPFPFKAGYQPGSRYSVEKAHLIVKDNECFVDKSRIKIISEFKADNFSTLLKYVKDNGSITFNISASEYENGLLVSNQEKKTAASVCEFLDTLYNICEGYKYYSLFFCQYSESFVSADVSDIYYTASFLDLYNCVPIFNHRKVDGIGVIFNMNLINPTKATGSLVSKACIALVLSNYKDNIFITDGIRINEIRPINPSVIKIIKNIVMANARIKDKFKIKVEDEENNVKNDFYDSNFQISNTSVISSVTGSYYYYT